MKQNTRSSITANISIRNALIAIISISLITLSLSMVTMNNSMFSSLFEQKVENEFLPTQLAKIKSNIRHQLSTPLELSKAISQNKFLIDWSLAGEPDSQQAEVIDFLNYMHKQNAATVVFYVSNVSNNYLDQGGVAKVINRESEKWFYEFLASGKDFEIAFDYDERRNKLSAFVNYRVHAQGKDLAIAGIGYSVDQVSQDILSNKIGQSGFVFISDMKGNIMIHPDLAGLKSRNLYQLDGFADTASRLLQAKPDYVFDSVNQNATEYYIASSGIPELGWKVFTMLPKNEPLAEIQSVTLKSELLSLILVIVFITIMVILSNRITRPIINIANRLLEMATQGGDLTQRLDESGNNEIGLLGKGFNAILGKVKEMMLETKQMDGLMATSFNKLTTNTCTVDGFIKQQQTESDSVATATTEMAHSIQEVSELASNTATKTESTQELLNAACERVDHSSHVMSQLQQSNSSTQDKIEQLAAQTQTISSVVDTISGISEQTNLLALNAAIEAARAGEQGRGFAVVADEVRSLAARTQNSTSEIKDVIESLQSQASDTVSAMNENSELANRGLEETNIAQNTLNEVVDDISQITDMNTQVATATHEQSNVISELNVNVTSIADVASQVSELSQQTNQIVFDLEEQKSQLNNLVSQFKTE